MPSRILMSLAVAALTLAYAAPSAAGPIYRWVTDDGVIAFADDPDRIPARYQQRVRREPRLRLANHGRFTPTDAVATTAYAKQLTERLERLREFNAGPASLSAGVPAPAPSHTLTLRTGRDTGLEFEVESDAAPLVVERRQLVDADTSFTRHVTVVRQGDRILSIVKPRSHFAQPPWGTIQELEEGR